MATPSTAISGGASVNPLRMPEPSFDRIYSPPPQPPPDDILNVFRDFDDAAVYAQVVAEAFAASAKSFVVDFGDTTARVAVDLSETQILQLLAEGDGDGDNFVPRHPSAPVRWINVWNPSAQQGIVEAIGRRYHFSRRLTMSIWAWDQVKAKLLEAKSAEELWRRPSPPQASAPPPPPPQSVVDIETGAVATAVASPASNGVDSDGKFGASFVAAPESPPAGGAALASAADDALDAMVSSNKAVFQIMQGSLNYTTIDQEQHYTVICFHEAAYYEKTPKFADRKAWETEELGHMRSNTLKVFRQLSKWGLKEDQHKFSQLTSVRQPGRRGPWPDSAAAQGVEGASNLFYYLFEDYTAAFDVLNSSKAALDDISSIVLRTADWKKRDDTTNVIPSLYKLNKEMRQLQHLFSNYNTLIDRLLSRNGTESEARNNGEPVTSPGPGNEGDAPPRFLSPKAVNRFRRLQVQLQSLMLDAIQDCLDEKASLQDTYFHLITQKDSRSTERLTRSATLLAKLSVFFLPISFMTSYFSVQIPDLTDGYTARTYWGAFAVIASVSFLSLFFFSKVLMFLSESLDHWADSGSRWTWEHIGQRKRTSRRTLQAEEDT
ncbi:ADP-ribosylation factor [Sporothrix brasiliensis 5110]|uniref:ADP-ribosylation factor n=1 Tax=Sporothrix brasiliensis 5110 TaxID=1398154 RepID=A0A0C2IQK0_9PEZI|nr:ADP-ribosylation factor [Sporothrix brasiliensis 5110]KIH91316.1 ADP-ribosylation factor [Sporothrix brasiliensis 5110]